MAQGTPVPAGSLVLVTGINGHVASTIALRLLDAGYRVRGTVRFLRSARVVREALVAKHGEEKLEILETGADIGKEGVFDRAVKGVDAVIHTPSPVNMDSASAEEQFVPAINGTLSIMRSAKRESSVKRFLWLGSIASVIYGTKDPATEILTRDDWNVTSEEAAKNKDDPFVGFHIYLGSKTAAERAAFEFIEKEKPGFTLTTILGPFIFGPIFKELSGPPRPDATLGGLYNLFANPARAQGVSPYESIIWVHSYDIADLFVASLTSSKTHNTRLLANAGRTSWAHVRSILRPVFPDRPYPPIDENAPTMRYPGSDKVRFDTRLEEELLEGGKWRTLEDAVVSCARDLMEKERKGWDRDD